MNSSSRDRAPSTEKATASPLPPSVPCDLCGYAMPTPTVRNPDGSIPGLFVCGQCLEDQLAAQTGGFDA